eukprot:2875781-Pyramimonas_sp.AAC.1
MAAKLEHLQVWVEENPKKSKLINYHIGRSKGEQQQHKRSDHDPRLPALTCATVAAAAQELEAAAGERDYLKQK